MGKSEDDSYKKSGYKFETMYSRNNCNYNVEREMVQRGLLQEDDDYYVMTIANLEVGF